MNTISLELNEHTKKVPGIRTLLLAQNRDVHVLEIIKKLIAKEPYDKEYFFENVRVFAQNFKQEKDLPPSE